MPVQTVLEDLIELSDWAWNRLHGRLAGMTDAEYRWEPGPDCWTVRRTADGAYRADGPAARDEVDRFTTLGWRVAHIVDVLAAERNGPWIGLGAVVLDRRGDPGSAAEGLRQLADAYAIWSGLLGSLTEESLNEPIGSVGGPFHESTRRSFVLHVLDELIHHGAEAALMRDLYALQS
jgi:uncharacterized damage-inducible protein DinB